MSAANAQVGPVFVTLGTADQPQQIRMTAAECRRLAAVLTDAAEAADEVGFGFPEGPAR